MFGCIGAPPVIEATLDDDLVTLMHTHVINTLAEPVTRWPPDDTDTDDTDTQTTDTIHGCIPLDDADVQRDVTFGVMAGLHREVLRTRALHAAAATDLDEATARLDATSSRLDTTLDAASAAAREVTVLRHQLAMAHADTHRARGERDLARAELAAARTATPDPATPDPATARPVTARLADDPPGPGLAQALRTLVGDLGVGPGTGPETDLGCLHGLSDDDVLTAATAAQRLANWAGAVQMHTAEHLRQRWAVGAATGDDDALWITACEIALATGLTRHAAAAQLEAADHLPTRMPRLFRRLAGGGIDPTTAVLITTKTLTLTPEQATAVETGLIARLDHTPRPTRPQLAALLDKLIAEATPETVEDAARQARAERGVAFRPLPHGMGQMTLTSGAEQIEAARAALNALTHAARGRGRAGDPDNPRSPCDPDGRHPDAVRADVLHDVLTAAAGLDGDPNPEPSHPSHPTDPPSPPGPGGGTTRDRRRAEIIVLAPLSVLTGQCDAPATLAGYGPIPGQLARELAATGTWRCAAVDDRHQSPTHGTLLGLGRSTYTPAYTPGPGLRRFIQTRDGTCQFPGCRHPAHRSELDHRTPWTEPTHPPGHTDRADDPDTAAAVTCDCNLHTLCSHHHRLKHTGWLTAHPAPHGGTTWTTRTGRTYTRRPDPLPY